MQLSGHQGEVFSCKFHPDGEVLASGGHDRQLFLWKTFGDCENLAALAGHKGAVLDVCFSAKGDKVFTASADKTVNVWDTGSCTRIKRLKAHTSVVNACSASRGQESLLVTASDDCTVKLWDTRTRLMVTSVKDKFQILCCCFNGDGNQVLFGGKLFCYSIVSSDLCHEWLLSQQESTTQSRCST